MTKAQTKAQIAPDQVKAQRQQAFDKKVKPLFGKLAEVSALSTGRLQLLDGKRVVWESPAVLKSQPKKTKQPKKKAAPKAVKAIQASSKKKGPGEAGRPEKTTVKTTVDELQALRESKTQRAKAVLQNKKKPVTQKKAAAASGKTQPGAFSVSRQPTVVKKQKRA